MYIVPSPYLLAVHGGQFTNFESPIDLALMNGSDCRIVLVAHVSPVHASCIFPFPPSLLLSDSSSSFLSRLSLSFSLSPSLFVRVS